MVSMLLSCKGMPSTFRILQAQVILQQIYAQSACTVCCTSDFSAQAVRSHHLAQAENMEYIKELHVMPTPRFVG